MWGTREPYAGSSIQCASLRPPCSIAAGPRAGGSLSNLQQFQSLFLSPRLQAEEDPCAQHVQHAAGAAHMLQRFQGILSALGMLRRHRPLCEQLSVSQACGVFDDPAQAAAVRAFVAASL